MSNTIRAFSPETLAYHRSVVENGKKLLHAFSQQVREIERKGAELENQVSQLEKSLSSEKNCEQIHPELSDPNELIYSITSLTLSAKLLFERTKPVFDLMKTSLHQKK